MYFEDLEVGQRYVSLARTVTETDLTVFSMMSGDWNPIHSDVEFARRTPSGQRLVHGVFGIALVTGLMDRAGWFADSAVAMLSIDDWRFVKRLLIGDTLHCEMEISSLRLTSSGTTGVVGRTFRLINQDDDVVQEGRCPALIRLRAA
nr:MaoC/PaaZ C-terminal domain-containing protein [Flexivirga oryzae]